MCVCMSVTQSCPALCDPMDFSVHGIFLARILAELPFPTPGNLPNQGSNPSLLNWQEDSLPLCHLGSPTAYVD